MTKQLVNLVKIAKQQLDMQEKNLLRNQTLITRKYADIDFYQYAELLVFLCPHLVASVLIKVEKKFYPSLSL